MDFDLLKFDAKAKVKGKIAILFLIEFIIGLIIGAAQGVLGFIPYSAGSLPCTIFLVAPFVISRTIIYTKVGNGGMPEVEDAFSGFKKYWDGVVVCFFQNLFIALWSLLLIIPGIIKAYAYSMTNYIFVENPHMKWKECMDKSQSMMMGHKKELFLLDLSFFGWLLLGIITFGISLIWTMPYFQATRYNYYVQLKNKGCEFSTMNGGNNNYRSDYKGFGDTGCDNPFNNTDNAENTDHNSDSTDNINN